MRSIHLGAELGKTQEFRVASTGSGFLMEAGFRDHVWTIEEMCSLLPEAESAAKRADGNLLLKALAK